jgi:FecR protein
MQPDENKPLSGPPLWPFPCIIKGDVFPQLGGDLMKLKLMAGLAGFLIMISSAVNAQTQEDPGVARISLIHGDVSTQRGDSGDWGAAVLNAPVVAGDHVSTGDRSRAEVQLDYANILRLDERTQANLTGLSHTQIQVELGRGLANYSVFKDTEADVEIDTPNMSLHPNRRDGSYRITVVSDDQTEVLVRKGDAEVSTPQGRTHIEQGQLIVVRGTGNDTQYKIAEAPSRDDFDRWNSDRDNIIRNAEARRHTNRYYVGSEDLDSNGHWTTVPDYGSVWVPTVDSGWAPYRDGRWVWEPYWGWTWVSYEPWGWAPYHYGRWFFYGSSWVWWPGPVFAQPFYRPIWAPAYVSFFGFGNGFAFGASFGSFGWIPIGPCDGFFPWWGFHRSRFNQVNITNITIINNFNRRGGIPPLRSGTRFSNLRLAATDEHVRRAISTVGANDFGRGRVTAQPVTREMFRGGKLMAGNLPVVPTRESLRVSDRAAAPSTVGRGTQPQHFFMKNRPAAAPQSFEREAAQVHNAIQRDGHFTPIVGNQRSAATEGNARPMPQARPGQTPAETRSGATQPGNKPSPAWRQSGQPEQQTPARSTLSTPAAPGPRKPPTSVEDNWRRFPSSGSTRGSGAPNSASPGSGNRTRNENTPDARRATTPEGNSQWRRLDRPTQPTNRGAGSNPASAPAPAARDRVQREAPTPPQNRGNDWRRMPPTQRSTPEQPTNRTERNDSWRLPARGPAPEAQRDSGSWRQAPSRSSGREVSRPPLDMRQPVVVPRSGGPRSAGPAPSGGYHGSSAGGGSRSSTPSRGSGQSHPSSSSGKPNRGR